MLTEPKKLPTPPTPPVPFIRRSAGVRFHDWELFGKRLFNTFFSSLFCTLNGEPPSPPDIYPFRKRQLKAFPWSSCVPTTQQRVTLMTSLWLLFSPRYSTGKADCLPDIPSATTGSAKNPPSVLMGSSKQLC